MDQIRSILTMICVAAVVLFLFEGIKARSATTEAIISHPGAHPIFAPDETSAEHDLAAEVHPSAPGNGEGMHPRERELTFFVEQDYIHFLARMNLPTIVSVPRRVLTLQLALHVLIHDVPGDFVETGVFQGGICIILLKLMNAVDRSQRRLFAADSFQGLPESVDQDQNTGAVGMFSSGLDAFINNLQEAGVWSEERVKVVQGWFNESLPAIKGDINGISFLRLDGDLYVSTMDALTNLYPLVSPCGVVYIDDYGSFPGCKRAVDEYRAEHNIEAQLHIQSKPEDNGLLEAAWWVVPCDTRRRK